MDQDGELGLSTGLSHTQTRVSILTLRLVILAKTAPGNTPVKHKKGGFHKLSGGKSDLLSDFYSDKSIKWRFLRLTRGLGVSIFTKIDAGGDKLETWFRVQVFLCGGN